MTHRQKVRRLLAVLLGLAIYSAISVPASPPELWALGWPAVLFANFVVLPVILACIVGAVILVVLLWEAE